MAEQAEYRVYKRKRIKNPADESMYVDIPVIYEARFKSMADQAQEFFIYFENGETSSRKAHTKRVTNGSDYVDAERIDEWTARIMQEQAQESTFIMKNSDPPPTQPDGSNSPSHQKVHIIRFFKDNNPGSGAWIDVELIDELNIKCMAEQAQEYIWYMKHPELGDPVSNSGVSYPVTIGFCDPNLPLAN